MSDNETSSLAPLYVRIVLSPPLLSNTTEYPVNSPFTVFPKNLIFSFFRSSFILLPFSSSPNSHIHPVFNPNLEKATAVFVPAPPTSNFKSLISIFSPIG